MTKTRGTAFLHNDFDSYVTMLDDKLNTDPIGTLYSMEAGESTAYSLNNAQERGELFIGGGVSVYEGMIIGECSRGSDLGVNPCKGKKLTNMRASGTDEAIVLTPPREMTLELAIEYIGPDELVEVTPKSIRLRKKVLDASKRKRNKTSE